MPATIRQAPGPYVDLVRVCCDNCGYTGPTRDLHDTPHLTRLRTEIERDQHQCGQQSQTDLIKPPTT
jgi:hypothetical protein